MAASILIVEDEYAVARGIQYALQQEGYQVSVARNGEEGLDFATHHAPDLIILDVRLHRGEMSVDEGVDFLVEQTSFERANARSEVQWYTYRPTYPLSYLLGRTLLLELRADEQRRLGDGFSLKGFHDTLMRNGSLPISFHRRLLAGEGR